MSTTTEKHTVRLTDRLSVVFGDLSLKYTQYKSYRDTLNELSTLSDRELADLGMSRSGLRSVAYQAAYGG